MKYSNQLKSSAAEQISKDMRTIRSAATRFFLGTLILFAVLNFCAILYLQFRPHSQIEASTSGFFEACRELCAKYGLVETGDLATDAKAYLAAARQEMNQTAGTTSTVSQEKPTTPAAHPLLGKSAPDFNLPNEKGESVRLSDLHKQGPVVVVFYYGYFCSHCVAQLFALNEELAEFARTGTTIVALSADPAEHTAEMFKEYGRFDFPVLSDEDRSVATSYGCYRPKCTTTDEDMLHGTFVVDQQGVIRWAYTGYTPYIDNKSLLKMLGELNQTSTSTENVSVTKK